MSERVANTGDLNAQFCATLVEEWVRQGVEHAVVAPGSRSTPLALALARHAGVRVTVVIDERSAAFRALGLGRSTQRPAVLLCTSGTAGAHFYPAVIEAHHSNVAMIVCTADRPPELRDTGAGQTIDQVAMFGGAVRWMCDPGAPDAPRPEVWRSIAARGFVTAQGDGTAPAGPVHYNLAFREPLLSASAAEGTDPTHQAHRAMGVPGPRSLPVEARPTLDAVEQMRDLVMSTPRGIFVVGWGAGVDTDDLQLLSLATGWPVLADAISNARRGDCVVSHYEAIVRDEPTARELIPDVVVRFGAGLTSKVTNEWLTSVPQHCVVDPNRNWLDPSRSCTLRISAHSSAVVHALVDALVDPLGDQHGVADGDRSWFEDWRHADRVVAEAFDDVFAQRTALDGARLGRDVMGDVPSGSCLLVASSMAVRDLEWCARPRDGIIVQSNRGVNGIDGMIATASGVALGSGAATYALIGDLAFLHDAGSLLGIRELGIDLTIVVINNDGGGIFSFLAQADRANASSTEFELLFGTPQQVDIAAIAAGYGVPSVRVTSGAELHASLTTNAGGVRVVIAETVDRQTEVVLHRELWSAASLGLAAARVS
jgi:2-succinyl-5-enolpyruvyl-6-hydroxy-3-cyclohexene-1-carboxylate synthase